MMVLEVGLGGVPGIWGRGRSVRETLGSNGILSLFIRWRGLFRSRVVLTEATVSGGRVAGLGPRGPQGM